MNIQEAAQIYLEHLITLGRSPRTIYTYSKDFEQIQAFFGSEKPITSINVLQVGKFYRSEALLKLPNGQDRAAQTVNKTLRVFRNWLVWLESNDQIEVAPLPKETPWKEEDNADEK